jgi:cytochrome c peroxidase
MLGLASTLATAGDPPPSPQAAIGWKLFFDPLLSRPQNTSCATCHNPDKGFGDGLRLGKGAYGQTLPRHTPSVVNLQNAPHLFWDGRVPSLEAQAIVPLTNPIEMDMTPSEIVSRVASQPHYQRAFAAIEVNDIRMDNIVGAIAAFERTLVTGPALFDRWLQGEKNALNEAQQRGRMIFFTRGQCAICHVGHNFTDHAFHNIGTGTGHDLGRFSITQQAEDQGSFKTPSLRNWKGREPFMHDGRFASIRDVLHYYSEPPRPEVGGSELDPLELEHDEITDLLAFLETLNGTWPDLSVYATVWETLSSP